MIKERALEFISVSAVIEQTVADDLWVERLVSLIENLEHFRCKIGLSEIVYRKKHVLACVYVASLQHVLEIGYDFLCAELVKKVVLPEKMYVVRI